MKHTLLKRTRQLLMIAAIFFSILLFGGIQPALADDHGDHNGGRDFPRQLSSLQLPPSSSRLLERRWWLPVYGLTSRSRRASVGRKAIRRPTLALLAAVGKIFRPSFTQFRPQGLFPSVAHESNLRSPCRGSHRRPSGPAPVDRGRGRHRSRRPGQGPAARPFN